MNCILAVIIGPTFRCSSGSTPSGRGSSLGQFSCTLTACTHGQFALLPRQGSINLKLIHLSDSQLTYVSFPIRHGPMPFGGKGAGQRERKAMALRAFQLSAYKKTPQSNILQSVRGQLLKYPVVIFEVKDGS